MKMVDIRKKKQIKRKTNDKKNPTQLKLLFQFVLEKGDETENFLRKRPDGNLSIDRLSNFTHTFWFIMVKWTKKTRIDNAWISEATTQNLYRNSLLAYTQSRWVDSSSICLWEETVTPEASGLWMFHHILPATTPRYSVIIVLKQKRLVQSSKDPQSFLYFKQSESPFTSASDTFAF